MQQDDLAICIIDDDVRVRRLLESILEHGGYTARTYACAESYLADLSVRGEGLCVVIDYRLPGMDGLGLLDELRERELDVPAVVVTGVTDVTLAVKAMRAGAVDVIPKPFDAGDLVQRVKRAVADAQQRARLRRHRSAIRARFDSLTGREREVVEGLVEGKAVKQLAAESGVTVQAVGARRRDAFRKLGVNNVVELVRIYLEARLEVGGSSGAGGAGEGAFVGSWQAVKKGFQGRGAPE